MLSFELDHKLGVDKTQLFGNVPSFLLHAIDEGVLVPHDLFEIRLLNVVKLVQQVDWRLNIGS